AYLIRENCVYGEYGETASDPQTPSGDCGVRRTDYQTGVSPGLRRRGTGKLPASKIVILRLQAVRKPITSRVSRPIRVPVSRSISGLRKASASFGKRPSTNGTVGEERIWLLGFETAPLH